MHIIFLMKKRKIEPAGTITIRASKSLKEVWREFKATAVRYDLTVPEALEEAIRLWIEEKGKEKEKNTA